MSEADKAKIFSAIEHDGTTWQVGSPVPKDNSTVIRKILMVDGVCEVYAEPLEGSELAKMNACLHFQLMPLGIKLVASVPPRDVWARMMRETEEGLEFDDDDDDDTGEYEDEEPQPTAVHAAQPTAVAPVQSYVPVMPVPVQAAPAPNGSPEV